MAHYTILSKQGLDQLASKFLLPPPLAFKPVLEGTVNTYYRLSYKDKILYLKIDEIGDKKRLLRELSILKSLQSAKLDFKTPIPLTIHKKAYIPYQNKFVLFIPEIKGRSMPVQKLKGHHLLQMGQALALIHKKTQNKKFAPHRFDLLGQTKVFGEISSRLIKKHPATYQWIKQKLKELKKLEPKKIPSGLIHADLFSENVLFEKNKLSGILDFEAGGHGAFLFDIAVTLHACCYQNKKFQKSLIAGFFKGYQSVRKLTTAEKKHLSYYLEQSAMRFLLTRLRDFELKDGPVKAKPFKDYREFVRRFEEIRGFTFLL